MEWYVGVLKKYADFKGRARRKEYWMFFMFNFLISIGLGMVDAMLGTGVLGMIYALAILLPSLAVGARRLHDIGKSGWWLLIGLIPLVGLVLLYFLVQPSQSENNEYGAPPLAAA